MVGDINRERPLKDPVPFLTAWDLYIASFLFLLASGKLATRVQDVAASSRQFSVMAISITTVRLLYLLFKSCLYLLSLKLLGRGDETLFKQL